MDESSPLRTVKSRAPIRICDNGGWTDTWFAGHGKVFNIAVSPFAEVQIEAFPRRYLDAQVRLNVVNYSDRYLYQPGAPWERHPLLEAAITRLGVPADLDFEITIASEAPAGGSTGTSAAVTVALLGALDALSSGGMTPHEIAYAAHAVETEMLRQQSGIQDQLCAAYGGVNFIDVFEYPHATVRPLPLSGDLRAELESRLTLVYLGKSHRSSAVHEKVLHDLQDLGPESKHLEDLRRAAELARDAVLAGDLEALGESMIANTDAQARLHPDLVGADAHKVIEVAQAHGASGWKVNGAGGDGGSLTLLGSPDREGKAAMVRQIEAANPLFQIVPIALSPQGLQVWLSANG